MRCLKKLTQKSPHFISYRAWFIRATRCTLRRNRELRIKVDSFVHKLHATRESVNCVSGLNHSCNKLHATRKSVNHVPWLNHSCYEGIANHVSEFIIRATSCTLRGNRGLRTAVDSFVHQDARYEEIGESRIGVIIRATSCTLRGNRESRIRVDSFVQQVARYGASYKGLPLRIKKARHFHVVLFC